MSKKISGKGFGSAAVHAGHHKDPRHAHQTPIYASSTFVFDSAEQGMRRFSGQEEGYIYSRWGNPTITEAEEKIAALETLGTDLTAKGILHASGMAAITTLCLSTLKTGDKVLSHFSLYGGTHELVTTVLPQLGITPLFNDMHDLNQVEDILKKEKDIRLVYLETPANPTLRCVDIAAISALAKKYNVPVACDNTFATPFLQQPFVLGADFIMHSTTKYLNGHGTAIGGILLGRDIDFMKKTATKKHRLLGGNANPFDAFLLTQGIKTLELRMQRHCENAIGVAAFLQNHSAVAQVNYEGIASHPDYAIAKKQMKQPGGMLSFELKGGMQAGVDFLNQLQMCTRTVSLGTVDTLLSHPASMTHFGVPKEEREKAGITDGLIRMNVGIENLQDIVADLEQALDKI